MVIGLGDSETGETGETGEAGLKAGDGLTGIFGLFAGDTIPDFFDFAAFAAAHFRNNRALTSFHTFKNEFTSTNNLDFVYIENFWLAFYQKYWNISNVPLLDPNNEVKIYFDYNLLGDPSRSHVVVSCF